MPEGTRILGIPHAAVNPNQEASKDPLSKASIPSGPPPSPRPAGPAQGLSRRRGAVTPSRRPSRLPGYPALEGRCVEVGGTNAVGLPCEGPWRVPPPRGREAIKGEHRRSLRIS